MASPFDVFRKNQKVLMALLVGLSMVAFILADSVDATTFPIFLGAAFGALGLWLLSGKGGPEGWAIAAVGAVLGAVVGWYGPSWLGNNTVVQTAEGNLSNRDILRIVQRQEQANQFLRQAYATIAEKLPEDQQRQLRQPPFFVFGDMSTPQGQKESAVLNFLFQKEADDLGITISDEAVARFLREAFDGKLTSTDLQRVRSEMRIGGGELVDVLREQMRAQEAFRLLVPRNGPTPQQLWSEFKKLQATAEITAVALPAESFVAQVPDPSSAELAAFFEQYKSVMPAAEGAPGFLVPREFQVAYVELPFDTVRKSVTPPTDAEVLAFYNTNRSQFEHPSPQTPAAKTPAGGAPPVEAPRPGAASPTEPAADAAADSAPETETPKDEAETPDEDTTPGESNSGVSIDGLEFVAFQKDQPAAEAAAPVEASTPPSAEDSAPSVPAPPAFPAPAGQDKPAAPPSPETLAAIREDLLNQRARDEADRRLQEIRDDVDKIVNEVMDQVLPPEDPQDEDAKKKYEEDHLQAVRTVRDRVEAYARKNGLRFDTTPYLSAAELYESEDYTIGKAVLWEPNRPFGQRDTLTVAEQVNMSSPDQPLGTIPAQSLMNDSRYVALKIDDRAPRVPSLDEKPSKGQRSIKEKVTEVWKLQKARALAEARAHELAKADDEKKDLAEVVKGQTVTGKAGGDPIVPEQVGPFTWMRESTAPGTSFAPPMHVPSELPQLPGAGEEFMRQVFEDAAPGRAVVGASDDKSTFFVVEVDKRSSEADMAAAREQFLKQDFFTDPFIQFGMPMNPYRRQMAIENDRLRADWIESFRAKHAVTDLSVDEAPAT